MLIPCPHDFKGRRKHPYGITSFSNEVNVYDGICDRPDLCKIKQCQFYDNTQEGTRKFLRASLYYTQTLSGQFEDKHNQKLYRAKLKWKVIDGGKPYSSL